MPSQHVAGSGPATLAKAVPPQRQKQSAAGYRAAATTSTLSHIPGEQLAVSDSEGEEAEDDAEEEEEQEEHEEKETEESAEEAEDEEAEDEDEEEEEEEEEEDEDDDDELVQLKLQIEGGDGITRILKVSDEIGFTAFMKEIAVKCGFPPPASGNRKNSGNDRTLTEASASTLYGTGSTTPSSPAPTTPGTAPAMPDVSYLDADGDRVRVDSKKAMRRAFQHFWDSEAEHLKLLVRPPQQPPAAAAATVPAIPAVPAGASSLFRAPSAVAAIPAMSVDLVGSVRQRSDSGGTIGASPKSDASSATPNRLHTPATTRGRTPVPAAGVVGASTANALQQQQQTAVRAPTPVRGPASVASEIVFGPRARSTTFSDITLASSTSGSSMGAAGGPSTPVSTAFASLEQGKEVQWSRIGKLGQGSYGSVFEAITHDGFLMAVKVVELPADRAEDVAEVGQLMKEINLMRTLHHPSIVTYYGCQTKRHPGHGLTLEIFLEHCHGGSLSSLRKKFDRAAGGDGNGAMPMPLVRSYTRQVLEGLAYLHAQRVIHRDIKSDNVLISATGEAKLADFGCGKRIGTLQSNFSASQGAQSGGLLNATVVGTPLFMAPEVIHDTGAGHNSAADVWSVGCLVIELLGRRPWLTEHGANMFSIMFRIASSKDMPTGIPPNCPADLLSFFYRCFERDAKLRATAAELLQHRWLTCPDSELQPIPSLAEAAPAASGAEFHASLSVQSTF